MSFEKIQNLSSLPLDAFRLKFGPMDIRNEYLERILGWKVVPAQHSWLVDQSQDLEESPAEPSAVVNVSHKVLLGVYAPELLEPGSQVLLKKMLSSIGLGDVPIVAEFSQFDRYIHVFWFDDGTFDEHATDARVWRFSSLNRYLKGDQKSITAYKKQAWTLLQQFKREAF